MFPTINPKTDAYTHLAANSLFVFGKQPLRVGGGDVAAGLVVAAHIVETG